MNFKRKSKLDLFLEEIKDILKDSNNNISKMSVKVTDLHRTAIPINELFANDQKEITELENKLEAAEKIIHSLNSAKGGYISRINNLEKELKKKDQKYKGMLDEYNKYSTESEKMIENLNKKVSENKTLAEELEKNRQTIKEQNDLIQKMNDELKKIKSKPNPPTIEELKKDKLFHGKKK